MENNAVSISDFKYENIGICSYPSEDFNSIIIFIIPNFFDGEFNQVECTEKQINVTASAYAS